MNSYIINNCGLKLLDASLNKWYPVGSLISNMYGFQSVRWRKPRWVPKAPSKLYVVTHRKKLPPDETKELLRLYQKWKCFTKLVVEHCGKENQIRAETGQASVLMMEQENEEHKQLMEYNRKENERVAALRNERLILEREQLVKEAKELKEKEAKRRTLERQIALQRIQDTEELVATFIEPEDVERAIEEAMKNPIDFNYSIDEDGRVYHGRNAQPHLIDQDTLPKLDVKNKGLTNVF